MRYLHARRAALGGYLPQRACRCDGGAGAAAGQLRAFALQADGKEMSTTMAFVRMLGRLLKDEALGPRVVPIVADEARTFGMANLFKQVGIYSSVGQHYEPEDIGSVLSYREARTGRSSKKASARPARIASWTAAATSYSVHGLAMLPFYIYYSMFGFQRVGDLIWAAADQRARGFLLGATAGRTTLGGEGLQHQDGSSHLVAAHAQLPRLGPGHRRRAGGDPRPRHARDAGAAARRLLLRHADEREPAAAHLPAGAGRRAARLLPFDDTGRRRRGQGRDAGRLGRHPGRGATGRAAAGGEGWRVDVLSITSWSELARDGLALEQARLQGDAAAAEPWLHTLLRDTRGPVVAATDYVRAVPEACAPSCPKAGAT
jgi:pyruvate dehydrogenase E1 component